MSAQMTRSFVTPSGAGAQLANDLFTRVLAPMVLGGALTPQHAVTGDAALDIGDVREIVDADLLSRVQLTRTRIARKYAAVDAPGDISAPCWSLAAVLNNLLLLVHPDLPSFLRPRAVEKLTQVSIATLNAIPAPDNVGEVLARHTLFSRLLDVARNDVSVRWWTGSAKFLGRSPPKRLLAWPERRRVVVDTDTRPWWQLPTGTDAGWFQQALRQFMDQSPLTKFAQCARDLAAFSFTPQTIAMLQWRDGRTLASRALDMQNAAAVDEVLGNAIGVIVATQNLQALQAVAALMADRTLREAQAFASAHAKGTTSHGATALAVSTSKNKVVAEAFGALAARQVIGLEGEAFSLHERRSMLQAVSARAQCDAAKWLQRELGMPIELAPH
jgi:hypothetical protein